MGGVLQIQAVFPDGAAVINRFGDYEDRQYVVSAAVERTGAYRLRARPLDPQGTPLSTKTAPVSALVRIMKALRLGEAHISDVRSRLKPGGEVEIGSVAAQRVFSVPELTAAGFEASDSE
jgi:hypothetical protein